MRVLDSLKNHLKSNYCNSLRSRNIIDNCAAGRALGTISVRKYRVPGHPIASGNSWGRNIMCNDDAIVTEQCGGGGNRDCNGSSTTARCERFEGIEEGKRRGYWMN